MFTTNPTRPSRWSDPHASSAREDARNDTTSRVRTSRSRSAVSAAASVIGPSALGQVQDDDVRHTGRGLRDDPELGGAETRSHLRRWREQDIDAGVVTPERVLQLLRPEVLTEGRRVGERVGGLGVVAGRGIQRLSDVPEHRIGVDQDDRAAARERSGEVCRHERDTHATAAAMDRQHRAPPGRALRPPDGGRGGPEELVAFLRPQEVPGSSRPDRGSQRAHRFADVERDHHPGRLRAAEQAGLGDHGVRLELPHRLRELTIVPRGGDDPRTTAAIEEVHHLLGHLRRLERQNHPRHLIHVSSRVWRGRLRP